MALAAINRWCLARGSFHLSMLQIIDISSSHEIPKKTEGLQMCKCPPQIQVLAFLERRKLFFQTRPTEKPSVSFRLFIYVGIVVLYFFFRGARDSSFSPGSRRSLLLLRPRVVEKRDRRVPVHGSRRPLPCPTSPFLLSPARPPPRSDRAFLGRIFSNRSRSAGHGSSQSDNSKGTSHGHPWPEPRRLFVGPRFQGGRPPHTCRTRRIRSELRVFFFVE